LDDPTRMKRAQSGTVSLRAVAIAGCVIAAGIALSAALSWLAMKELAADPRGANDAAPPAVEGARLQSAPRVELAAFLREKRERLESYGWIDRDAGRAHIPIERAMRLMAGADDRGAAAPAHADIVAPASVDFEQRLNRTLPLAAAYRDEAGRAVRLGEYFGGVPVILILGYLECPNLCSTALAGTIESLDRAGLRPGRDYRAVFASIDPRDAPREAAARKSQQVPAASQDAWTFLTGRDEAIRALAQAVGFRYSYDAAQRQFAHPAGFVVLTGAGAIARYFPGVRFEPRDVRLAVTEAGQGRTGTLADRLLLLCYHYDPATGKYGPAIWNGIRIATLLFMTVLGFWIWTLKRRGRDRGGKRR
jgi:protein SCO1